MAANQSAAPIIIKKIKKGGHGHHGGAWKVAFADFVTAMMAFFMLMWLMGSTTPEQKATIANYFNDPMATTGYSGNGAGNPALNGGDGILAGRGQNAMTGQSDNPENTTTHGPSQEEDEEALEKAQMVRMMEELKSIIAAGKELNQYADQVLFDITPEGLRIQIIDKENRAMFDQGSARLESYTRDILHEMVKIISQAPNRISISGHTDAKPYADDSEYGNWELSADRANAARRELLAGGLAEEKVGRVVGLGPSDLLDPSQPEAPLNRRISIVVLRGDHGKAVPVDGANPNPAAPAPADRSSTDSAPVIEPPAEATSGPSAEPAPPPAAQPHATAELAAEAPDAVAAPTTAPAKTLRAKTAKGARTQKKVANR